MIVVIAGAGRAGLNVAAHLLSAGHNVTLIDRDPAIVKNAFEAHGIVSLAGDATDARVLREAEVHKADVAVAMLPRDADNLAFAALARTAGAKRIMVRVKDEEYRAIYVQAGVHRILSETDVFIGALATAIEHENVRASMLVGNGEAVAFELELSEDAAVAGKTVSEIATSPGFPSSCVFAGLHPRGSRVEAPRGGSTIAPGTTLLLVSRRDELGAVIDFFTRSSAAR
ncbi:MAG: TrkA family potassium uptake protein [Polyangiaceae bacterium]|nr:TrkA family potassium uptake protein [Polyangiaceae bacterium]